MLLKMPGVLSTSSAARSPIGSGSAGGCCNDITDAGNAVGVSDGAAAGVTGAIPLIAGAWSGMGEELQSQKRVLSITSDALQWPSFASAKIPRVGRLTSC